jgi:hypothetical protein
VDNSNSKFCLDVAEKPVGPISVASPVYLSIEYKQLFCKLIEYKSPSREIAKPLKLELLIVPINVGKAVKMSIEYKL